MTQYHSRGFTLMELMIVVALIGIITAVAFGNYGESVMKSKRTDARTALMNTSTSLEKCKTIYGVYNNPNCSIGNGASIDSSDGYYTVSVATTATTYTLTASPSAGSSQQKDDACKTIVLNHLGQQTATGTNTSDCW